MNTLTKILQELIQINSANPPGNEDLIVSYIQSKLSLAADMKVYSHGSGRSSLVVKVPGKSSETIAFIGHMDTVPVTNPEDWKDPPFAGSIHDGVMYGRGTSDMKSGLACMIYLLEHFINRQLTPAKTLQFLFTADEEKAGLGIKTLIEEGVFENLSAMIVTEPTDEKIIIKEKGALWLELEIFGLSSHGSQPEHGINSIEILYELVRRWKAWMENVPADDILGKATLALNKIQGGSQVNITADHCCGALDIRTISVESHHQFLKYLDETIVSFQKEIPGLIIRKNVLNNRIPLAMDPDHPFVRTIRQAFRQCQLPEHIQGVTYFTDAAFILEHHPIPFVLLGPGHIDQCHVTNEHVHLAALERMVSVYLSAIEEK